MKKSLLTLSLLAAAAAPAHAAPTGNDLHESCTNLLAGELACTMFVAGFIFGMNGQANASNSMPLFCTPENATPLQITDIYKKYLVDNPHERHRPAVDLLVESVSEHWVCPDSR